MERKDSGNDRHREPPAGRFAEYDVTRAGRDTCPFCEVKVVDYEKIPGRWTNELLWSNWHLIPPIQQNLIIIQPVRRPVKTSELAGNTSIFTCCYNHHEHDPFYKTTGQWYIFAGVKAYRAVKKRRGTKDRAARSSGMSHYAFGQAQSTVTKQECIMNKPFIYILSVLLVFQAGNSQATDKTIVTTKTEEGKSRIIETITKAELRDHIFYLSSDFTEGRLPGSEGYKQASCCVASQLMAAGSTPILDGPDGTKSYFQAVDFTISSPVL